MTVEISELTSEKFNKVGILYSWKLCAVIDTCISEVFLLISLNIHMDRSDTDKNYLQNVLVYSSGRGKNVFVRTGNV
jgi:hypothetical protein